jgi:hypothetical protein
MGRVLDHIDDATKTWISNQHMFFVATAPSRDGRVNVSPKGLDSLRVLGEREVVYLDLTGSGAETIAHIRDNGRITLMWNAFDGPPRIVRVYGKGRRAPPSNRALQRARGAVSTTAGDQVRHNNRGREGSGLVRLLRPEDAIHERSIAV